MFGSLVIVYPAAYDGGELILRHKDREWKFDANSLIASQTSPSLAYIAFYSDIEHEVLKVTSGRRVTITYNLYLVDPLKPGASAVTPDLRSISNLQTTLQGLLKSPEFLPRGGTLRFGLAHLYPVTFKTKPQDLAGYLKGEDAHVYQACRELQLQPSLQIIYDDAESGRKSKYGIMLDQFVEDPNYDYLNEMCYERFLVEKLGGVSVNKTAKAMPDNSLWVSKEGHRGEYITWISPFNRRNQLRDINRAYGNEFSASFIYCSPCIIVRVPPASDRV